MDWSDIVQKKVLCITLSFIMLFLIVVPVRATTISNVKEDIKKTESNLNEVSNSISELQQNKQSVSAEIDQLDAQLVDILTCISICQDEINAKEEQVKQAKADLQTATEQEATQYEAMKTRMKFMYEQGDLAYVQLFLESESYSEMINKADYVEKVYTFDREQLEEYKAVKEEVATLKTTLEQEEAELLATNLELQGEQDALEVTKQEMQGMVADFDAQLATATQKAAGYKSLLKQQTEQIKILEEQQKAAVAAAAKENGKNTTTASNENAGVTTNTDIIGNNDGEEGNNSQNITPSSSGSALGRQIAAYGCQFVGNPYVFGGTSLTSGTDCSGFTQAVYQNFGYSIPRDSTSQRSCGQSVSYADAQPGDLICYAGHVALYIGNGQIVHASTPSTGIKYGTATYRTILSVRRII